MLGTRDVRTYVDNVQDRSMTSKNSLGRHTKCWSQQQSSICRSLILRIKNTDLLCRWCCTGITASTGLISLSPQKLTRALKGSRIITELFLGDIGLTKAPSLRGRTFAVTDMCTLLMRARPSRRIHDLRVVEWIDGSCAVARGWTLEVSVKSD